ncbi:origin recognition complex subunit 1-like [Tropilaelaps mercedesae]|uniref:Origin recognition complex subunit 1 n=1 Tax=Tropilaelaps mercedesae TaxID=418985 RepID=A0A1V9XWL1_9ACAR|nr:origin recognition complex subunit 1-like [Tropilaelaps mercedesae]
MSTRNRRRPSPPSSSDVLDQEMSFRWGEDAARPSSVSNRQAVKFYYGFEWNGVQYRRKDCVFIANAEAPDPNDANQLYVARLEELCDLGEDSKLGYRYQGWVTWYIRPEEARKDGIILPDDINDSEVLLSNPKTSNKKIDLEAIQSRCTVIHVPEHVIDYKWANDRDDKGNPQLYCRFQIVNRRKLKPVVSAQETPPKAFTSHDNKKNDAVADGRMDVDSLPLQYRDVIEKEVVVDLSPRKRVSPMKLVRSKTKKNQYTPEKRIRPASPSQDTVDQISTGMNDLVVQTPRSALREVISNKAETPRTPKSTTVNRTDSNATTRYGRKVRRAMFFDEEEFHTPQVGSPVQKLEELRDEDLVSEDSYVRSTGTESSDESDQEVTSSDEEVTVKRRAKHGYKKGTKQTPSTKQGSTRPVRRTPVTPKRPNVSRFTRKATPRMQSRRVVRGKLKDNNFENALEKLHVCAVPDQLACRETQFAEIYDFVESRLADEIGGCMYISGVPGTGKTATVREVMEALNKAQRDDEVTKFKYIEINGMKLTEPHQAYVQILKQLTGKKATPEHAADILTNIFKGKKDSTGDEMVVLLADELDLLWTRKQQVLYNLFDWPTHPSSRLVVIAIANTMDLPERMVMNKVASRMGLCRMTFQPYTFQELQEIVRARLAGLDMMDPDAIQFVSRKVAALSGDARRALDVCRRAVELSAQPDHQKMDKHPPASPSKLGKRYPVAMSHVNQAIQEMFSSAKVIAIRSLSLHEQILLRAIVEEFKRTGVEETVFHKVQSQYDTLARLDGVAPVNCTLLSTMLARLGSWRLVTLSDSRHDFHQKISMNVTQDDVHFALSRLKVNDNSD